MASKYVCPHCGSDKIKKEFPEDDEYCCSACLEFFDTPKEITSGEKPPVIQNKSTSKEEKKPMALDKDKIKALHAQGKTDKEIAEILNAKVGTVWKARNKMGLKINNANPQMPVVSPNGKNILDKEKIKELISAGKSVPEICTETGYNKHSVRAVMKRLGLKCTKDGREGNKGKLLDQKKYKEAERVNKEVAKNFRTTGPAKPISAKKFKETVMPQFNPGDNPVNGSIISLIDAVISIHQAEIDKLNKAKQVLVA